MNANNSQIKSTAGVPHRRNLRRPRQKNCEAQKRQFIIFLVFVITEISCKSAFLWEMCIGHTKIRRTEKAYRKS